MCIIEGQNKTHIHHKDIIDLETKKHNDTIEIDKEHIAVAKDTAQDFICALNGIGASSRSIGVVVMIEN